MDREAAAALLGVATTANRDEVHAAFRKTAPAFHPDAGGTHEEFDLLVAARDLLLEPVGDPTSAGSAADSGLRHMASDPTAPRHASSDAAAPSNPRARLAYNRRAEDLARLPRGCLWAYAVFTLAAASVVGLILLLAVFVGGDDGRVEPGPRLGECLVVEPGASPRAAECTVNGALQLERRYLGSRTCEPGLDTLVVGGDTWCLSSVGG